jgi:hypothetical protein
MNKQIIIGIAVGVSLVGLLAFAVVEKPKNKNFEKAGEILNWLRLVAGFMAEIIVVDYTVGRWCDSVSQINWRTVLPFTQTNLSHGFRDRNAKGGVTVQDRNAHLNLRDVAVKVACHQPLTKQFHTMHLCLNAVSAVVSAPVPSERTTQILRCAERIIPGDGTGGSWLPWLSISAWRDDGGRTAVSDSVVASARVVCAIRSHAADLLIVRDLVE